jgi:hypothetical protein
MWERTPTASSHLYALAANFWSPIRALSGLQESNALPLPESAFGPEADVHSNITATTCKGREPSQQP